MAIKFIFSKRQNKTNLKCTLKSLSDGTAANRFKCHCTVWRTSRIKSTKVLWQVVLPALFKRIFYEEKPRLPKSEAMTLTVLLILRTHFFRHDDQNAKNKIASGKGTVNSNSRCRFFNTLRRQ